MWMFFMYIMCYDMSFYFIHRLLHTKYLYFIHKIHHAKYNPAYYDFYTIDILELPFQSLCLLLPLFYKIRFYQFLCALLFINLRGMMEHDERFKYLIGDHHLVHHKMIKYNYGEYWIDYIFGTVYNKNRLIKK